MSKFIQNKDKIIAGVLSILGIGTLTSCYGMTPPREGLRYIEGNVCGMTDGNETKPLGNILVTDESTGQVYETDSTGYFQIMTWEKRQKNIVISFADNDSTENGMFKTKEIDVSLSDGNTNIALGEIVLDKIN